MAHITALRPSAGPTGTSGNSVPPTKPRAQAEALLSRASPLRHLALLPLVGGRSAREKTWHLLGRGGAQEADGGGQMMAVLYPLTAGSCAAAKHSSSRSAVCKLLMEVKHPLVAGFEVCGRNCVSEGTSRASLPYLAAIHHNRAAVCLNVAHTAALWPSGPTGTFGNSVPPWHKTSCECRSPRSTAPCTWRATP